MPFLLLLNLKGSYTVNYVNRESTLKEAKKKKFAKCKTASLKAFMNTMAQTGRNDETLTYKSCE